MIGPSVVRSIGCDSSLVFLLAVKRTTLLSGIRSAAVCSTERRRDSRELGGLTETDIDNQLYCPRSLDQREKHVHREQSQ